MIRTGLRGLALGLVSLGLATWVWAQEADPLTAWVLLQTRESGGLCAIPSCRDPRVGLAVAGRGRHVVVAGFAAEELNARVRVLADARRLLNRSYYAEHTPDGHMPLADASAELVLATDVTDDTLGALSAAEIRRVMAPRGRAIIGGLVGLTRPALEKWLQDGGIAGAAFPDRGAGVFAVFRAPAVEGIDHWGHWFHGPDNNPVSADRVVRWPFLTAWLGLPYVGTQPRNTIECDGRLFSITGPCAPRGHYFWNPEAEASADVLVARSAFNGVELWRRALPAGMYVERSALVAASNAVYVIDREGVAELEPASGKERRRIVVEEMRGEPKWIALESGRLLVLGGDPDAPAVSAMGRYVGLPPADAGTNHWGFGSQFAAVNAADGRTLWRRDLGASVDGRLVGVAAGRLFYYAERSHVGCLDAATGATMWTNSAPDVLAALAELLPGMQFTSLGTQRPALLATPEAAYLNRTGSPNLLALAAEDGRVLWRKAKRGGGTDKFVEAGKLYAEGVGLVDALTGEDAGRINVNSSGCGPITASPCGYYSRHGISFDRVRGQPVQDHSFRTGCYQDAFVADGLMFAPPYACGCSYTVRGFVTLAPAGDADLSAVTSAQTRLFTVKDPGNVSPLPFDAKDWTTHRADVRRSGSLAVAVGTNAFERWRTKAPPHTWALTDAVTAGKYVYVGTDDGKVLCLTGSGGAVRWEYPTGGAILAAPTLWEGRVFAGSADGHVYAMDAGNGRLLWRFRAAPRERRIMVYGSLSSTWPVHTGVLVSGGTAYFAAGIVDRDGTHVYAVDAATGAVKWENHDSGFVDRENRKGVSAAGYMTIAGGTLWLAGGNAVSPAGYALATGALVPPAFQSVSAYEAVRRGRELGAFDDRTLVGGGRILFAGSWERKRLGSGQEFAFVSLGDDGKVVLPEVVLTPGSIAPAWDERHTVVSVGSADDVLCLDTAGTRAFLPAFRAEHPLPEWKKGHHRPAYVAATPNPRTPPEFPMRAWGPVKADLFGVALAANAAVALTTRTEGDSGARWFVTALGRDDGKPLWEHELPAEPVLNGLCLNRLGDVIVTLVDGRLVCVGTR